LKYLNQINTVLMLVGCLVVTYSFTVTYWKQGPQASRVPLAPQLGDSSEGVSSAGSPLLRRAATTSSSAVERVVPRRRLRSPVVAGESAPPVVAPPASPEAVSESSRTAGVSARPNVSRVGEKREAVTVGRQASENAPSRAPAAPQRSSADGSDSIAPRNQPPRPADTAASQKRNESRSQSTPPVRSSMMGRRPR